MQYLVSSAGGSFSSGQQRQWSKLCCWQSWQVFKPTELQLSVLGQYFWGDWWSTTWACVWGCLYSGGKEACLFVIIAYNFLLQLIEMVGFIYVRSVYFWYKYMVLKFPVVCLCFLWSLFVLAPTALYFTLNPHFGSRSRISFANMKEEERVNEYGNYLETCCRSRR